MRALRCDAPVMTSPNSFLIHSTTCGCQCPQDEATIEVSFVWSNAGFDPWEKLQFSAHLDTNLSTLGKKIEAVCDEAITNHKPFLRELYANGRDVKGEARFWSMNAAPFANPTATGRYRIEKVRDLFKSLESKTEQCLVPVRVQLEVITKPLQVSRKTAELASKTYIRHQDGLSLPQSDESTHSKLVQTQVHQHYGPCVSGKCFNEKKLDVLVREVNGMSIGSIDNVEASKPWHPRPVEWYANNPNGDWYDYDHLPELPNMTFNDYVPDANMVGLAAALLQKSRLRIDLAIRLVNRIPTSQHGIPLREEKLPANVLMSVPDYDSTGQQKLIWDTLLKELESRGKKDPKTYRFTAAILKNDFTVHLWILPQAGAKKLYEFKGGLADYLDVNEVEKGNTKMYMEAHIVPMAETAKPQSPTSALLRVVDLGSEYTASSEEDKYPQKRQERKAQDIAEDVRRLLMVCSVREDLKSEEGDGEGDKYPQWMEGETEDDYAERLDLISSVRDDLKSGEEEEKYPQRREGEDEADYERRLEAEEIKAVRQKERRQVSSDEGESKPVRFGAKFGGRGD